MGHAPAKPESISENFKKIKGGSAPEKSKRLELWSVHGEARGSGIVIENWHIQMQRIRLSADVHIHAIHPRISERVLLARFWVACHRGRC